MSGRFEISRTKPGSITHAPNAITVLLQGAFPYGSNVSLDNVIGLYYPKDTDLTQ